MSISSTCPQKNYVVQPNSFQIRFQNANSSNGVAQNLIGRNETKDEEFTMQQFDSLNFNMAGATVVAKTLSADDLNPNFVKNSNSGPFQVQLVNGQAAIQANCQQIQTPNGPVIILPDFLRNYFVQVQQNPQVQFQQNQQVQFQQNPQIQVETRPPLTNSPSEPKRRLQPIQPRKRTIPYADPTKSASPSLLAIPAASTAAATIYSAPILSSTPPVFQQAVLAPQQYQHVVQQHQQVQQVVQQRNGTPTPPKMTLHLSGVEAQEISALTDEMTRILSSPTLTDADRQMVENLDQKRRSILKRQLVQQQQTTVSYDQQISTSIVPVCSNVVSSCANNSQFPNAQAAIPAQIVQINGMSFLALSSNNQNPNNQTAFSVVSTEMQRIQPTGVATTSMGIQMSSHQNMISSQGQSMATAISSNDKSCGSTSKHYFTSVKSRVTSTFAEKSSEEDPQKRQISHVNKLLADDQLLCRDPDLKRPFANSVDAISRLLPYHVFAEPNVSESFLEKVDESFNSKMRILNDQKSKLFRRFQHALLKDSSEMFSRSEYGLISYLISSRESEMLNKEREHAEKSPEKFVKKLLKKRRKVESNSSTIDQEEPNQKSSIEEIVTEEKTIHSNICLIKTEIGESAFFERNEQNLNGFPSLSPRLMVATPPHFQPDDIGVECRITKKLNLKRKLLSSPSSDKHSTSSDEMAPDEASTQEAVANDDERLKKINEIPKLLLKIKRRRIVEKNGVTDCKRVPPLKIKLNKTPNVPTPLTRLSSIGLESSDSGDEECEKKEDAFKLLSTPLTNFFSENSLVLNVDEDNKPYSNREYLVRQLKLPLVDESIGLSLEASPISDDWDRRTAQFIRTKLKINDECLSPDL